MNGVEKKRELEKEVITNMVTLYCRKYHKTKGKKLCDECDELLKYSIQRTENCPYMAEKTFCSACKTHCYRRDMKERIRVVMRWAGPRLLFVHPILTIKHLIQSIKDKWK